MRILDSYRLRLGSDLVSREGQESEQALRLFEAPFVVVSHGTQDDPILNYGNRVALELWEVSLKELLQMPSRLTAEPMERDERAKMLEQTSRDGFISDYKGIRISKTGCRFAIDQATVWNLVDGEGAPAGQAATFSEWTFLEAAS